MASMLPSPSTQGYMNSAYQFMTARKGDLEPVPSSPLSNATEDEETILEDL